MNSKDKTNKKRFQRITLFVMTITSVILIFNVTTAYAARFRSYGWPSATVPVKTYSYNSTWQTPMNQSVLNWNGTPTRIGFSKSSSSSNNIYASQYSWSDYGKCTSTYTGSKITNYTIKLNSRTISADATNLSNFIQSVFVHELGHTIWLGDNPNTSSSSIMKYSRNRNSMTKPSSYDISSVNTKY